MPERFDQSTTILRCPESLFECQLCMDEFRSPRVLPCQHIFCRNCVVKLAKRRDNTAERWYKCPVCRKLWSAGSTEINGSGGDKTVGFPESLLMKNLLGYRKDHGVKFRNASVNTEIGTTVASTQTEDLDNRRVQTPMFQYGQLRSVQGVIQSLILFFLVVPRAVLKWYGILFFMCGMINTYFYYAHDINLGLLAVYASISVKVLVGVFLWVAVITFICCILCMDSPQKATPSLPRRKPRTPGWLRFMKLSNAKEKHVNLR